MAWTTPGTAVAGDVLTAAFWNEQVRDNLDSVLSLGKVALFRDEKAQNTAGGTFNASAWRTRVLNTTVQNSITGASLASNQVTLPAGSYFVIARAPAFRVAAHKARLQNITDATTIAVGTTTYSDSGGNYSQNDSFIFTFFVIADTKTIELQHFCNAGGVTNGFGVASNIATEVFSELLVWKVS